jgi:hypothetical protein
MKLDRNLNPNGRGKYALLKLRKLTEFETPGTPQHMHRESIRHAMKLLETHGILDWGNTTDSEFMVIRLKDKYADSALAAYAISARADDPEYAYEIAEMADRAGASHPNCKKPD